MNFKHYAGLALLLAVALIICIPLIWALHQAGDTFTHASIGIFTAAGALITTTLYVLMACIIAAPIVALLYGIFRARERRKYGWHFLRANKYGNYAQPFDLTTGRLTRVEPGNYQELPENYHNAPHITERVIEAEPVVPQVAPPLTLPGPMRLLDVMQRKSFAGIYLASGKGQKEIECTLGGLLHAAHDAPTGQGKTNQWKSEIIQLRKHKVFVILCNPHFLPISRSGEDWRPIGKSIEEQGTIEIMSGVYLPGLVRKYEQIVQFLRWLSLKEIDSRFARATRGDFTYPVLYLFIDEWPAIVRRFPEAADYLVDVLQRGRAVDICCSVNAQGFLQGDVDLKGSARENFNTAFHMGGNGFSGSKLLDMPQKGYNDLLKNEQITLGKGIALLRNNEVCPQAELVRLPLVDNESVYYLLGRADDWTLPEYRGTSAHTSASSSAQRGSDDFRASEVFQEAGGSENGENTDVSTVSALREIGKRLRNGEEPAKIVRSYGFPDGRATQQLRATVDMVQDMIERGEL